MIEPRRSWSDAFAFFLQRKTREAIVAATPPYLTELAAAERSMRAVGNAWSVARFAGSFYLSTATESDAPVCSLVFVQSADGNTVASDPASLGGGQTDKHIVYQGLSRVAADAVLAGAGTVRGGQTIFSVCILSW
jgi:hypothetical protein